MLKILGFAKDTASEFKKINWPKSKEVLSNCALVMIVTCIVSVFAFLVDSVVYKFVHFILSF